MKALANLWKAGLLYRGFFPISRLILFSAVSHAAEMSACAPSCAAVCAPSQRGRQVNLALPCPAARRHRLPLTGREENTSTISCQFNSYPATLMQNVLLGRGGGNTILEYFMYIQSSAYLRDLMETWLQLTAWIRKQRSRLLATAKRALLEANSWSSVRPKCSLSFLTPH